MKRPTVKHEADPENPVEEEEEVLQSPEVSRPLQEKPKYQCKLIRGHRVLTGKQSLTQALCLGYSYVTWSSCRILNVGWHLSLTHLLAFGTLLLILNCLTKLICHVLLISMGNMSSTEQKLRTRQGNMVKMQVGIGGREMKENSSFVEW